MVLALVLIVLAILLGLGGLLFTALKWLLIVAAIFLIAGIVAGFLTRRRASRSTSAEPRWLRRQRPGRRAGQPRTPWWSTDGCKRISADCLRETSAPRRGEHDHAGTCDG